MCNLLVVDNGVMVAHFLYLILFFKILFISFLERGEVREKERERNISVWLPLERPSLGSWPASQAW